MAVAKPLKQTPIHQCHVELGGRLVEFAGWEMPVSYSGVIEEHRAVRSAAGLFDVSHMGEIRVRGEGAEAFVDRLTPNRVEGLANGRAQYSALLNEDGAYIDDLLVYRFAENDFLLVVNAGNTEVDLEWVASHAGGRVVVEDVSEETALLALQGPVSEKILGRVTSLDLEGLTYYRFVSGVVCGVEMTVSRTGYTGEDGFELYLPSTLAASIWEQLLDAGDDWGLVPVGLGARDTLRLEAGLALYGHEIDATVTPLEAGLAWVVKLDGSDFIGKSALLRQRQDGVPRKLVGLELEGRRIARQGAEVLSGEVVVGSVTSGTWSPTLEKPIGLALVDAACRGLAESAGVGVRGRREPARLTDLPFYKRQRVQEA